MAPRPSTLSARSPVRFVLGKFFLALFSISLVISTTFFAVAWFTVFRDARSMKHQMLSDVTGVAILGHAIRLDLDAHVLSISWKVAVCGSNATSRNPLWDDVPIPAHCEPFDKALDVYLDDPSNPIFSFAPSTEPVNKRLSVLDPPGFVMEHRFDKHGEWDLTRDLMVPFQRYSFNTFAFAIDPTTNQSVHIVTFGVLDILGDLIIRSCDAGDTKKFTYDSGDGPVTTEVESRLLRVEIAQSAVAKAYAICMFLVNWALTVGSVYIAALVTFGMLEPNSVVAALPFSALLAIPTIRSLYIDSPPLRIPIDAVAFFVQIVTVGLCSLALSRAITNCQPPASRTTASPV